MDGVAKRICAGAAIVVASVCLSSGAMAGVITLQDQDLSVALGGSPVAAGALLVTEMTVPLGGNLTATVYSQAYTGANGLYAYLYQVVNAGAAGAASVEEFTVWPFYGTDPYTAVLGYLTGGVPTGFLPGGENPWSKAGVDATTTGGPTFSFNYQQIFDNSIAPGDHSAVMYVICSQSPDQIMGNVIDGSVATGSVVGPLPEPATLSLLVLGGMGLILRRRKSGK
jgi:hypothetical protein